MKKSAARFSRPWKLKLRDVGPDGFGFVDFVNRAGEVTDSMAIAMPPFVWGPGRVFSEITNEELILALLNDGRVVVLRLDPTWGWVLRDSPNRGGAVVSDRIGATQVKYWWPVPAEIAERPVRYGLSISEEARQKWREASLARFNKNKGLKITPRPRPRVKG